MFLKITFEFYLILYPLFSPHFNYSLKVLLKGNAHCVMHKAHYKNVIYHKLALYAI